MDVRFVGTWLSGSLAAALMACGNAPEARHFADHADAGAGGGAGAFGEAGWCDGVTCDTPPASQCKDGSILETYSSPGTCAHGTCTYAATEMPCQHGCTDNACNSGPCDGVPCDSPPAASCIDSNTLREYSASGACNEGVCEYAHDDVSCPYGCQHAVCLECSSPVDCGPGRVCVDQACVDCDSDDRCGSGCTDCVALGQFCEAGACVECADQAPCAAGSWCDEGHCAACDTGDHCGPSCGLCTGDTPACDGTSCSCTATSCGGNRECVGGACVLCATDDSCGEECSVCADPTPRCLEQGSVSQCVACLTVADCPAGHACTGNACVSTTCQQPSEACTGGNQNRAGCANARVISRLVASAGSGFFASANTCSATDASEGPDSASCWDYGRDHSYRIFLRAGESIAVGLSLGGKCSNATSWNSVFKVYAGTGCQDKSCTAKLVCKSVGTGTFQHTFVAPADGWYVLVVDGRTSAYDDSGTYSLGVLLTCSASGCGC